MEWIGSSHAKCGYFALQLSIRAFGQLSLLNSEKREESNKATEV